MNSKLTIEQQERQQQQYEDLSSVNKNNITSTSLSSVERQKASRREKDRERKNLAHTKRNEDYVHHPQLKKKKRQRVERKTESGKRKSKFKN